MAGLTDQGFITKRFPELLIDGRQTATTLFQDLVEVGDVVDTSESSTLGRLIALKTPSEADLWEAAQEVYSAFDPNSATGISLDNMILLSGIPARFENTYTTSQVLLSGDIGTVVSSGSIVSSPTTGQQYSIITPVTLSLENNSGITLNPTTISNSTPYTFSYTRLSITTTVSYTSSVSATRANIVAGIKALVDASFPDLIATINADGTLKIDLSDIFFVATWDTSSNLGVTKVVKLGDVQATAFGPVDQPVNTITQISTPILGWNSVTNPVAAVPGRFRETDEELRTRFRNTKYDRATGTVEAIYSALFSLDNVTQVFIDENDTSITNANGTPGHSFLVLIEGGTSVEIATAIYENRPAGILSYGNTSVQIYDKYGYQRIVRFSRPSLIEIYIEIGLTKYADFPSDGEQQIKNALVSYVDGLSIGQDIVYSRLYTPINSVPGHEVNSLKIGTTPSPTGTTNIPIAFDQVAQLLQTNITFI